MKYQVEDWVWTPDRQWKIQEHLYSANTVLMLYKYTLDTYEIFHNEHLEQAQKELENEIQHLERALELEKENYK